MPWWFWIVLWVALIALSLLYVGLLGLRLWRELGATRRELETASARLSAYRSERQDALAQLARQSDDDGGPPRPAPGASVFASPEQMKDDYTAAKAARQSVRRLRRRIRRAERGQLQSLRDAEPSSTLPKL